MGPMPARPCLNCTATFWAADLGPVLLVKRRRAARRPSGVVQELDAWLGKADAPGFVERAQSLFEGLLAGAKCLANCLGRAVVVEAQPAPAALEGLDDSQGQRRHAPVTGLVEAQINLAVWPQRAHKALESLADGHWDRNPFVVKQTRVAAFYQGLVTQGGFLGYEELHLLAGSIIRRLDC